MALFATPLPQSPRSDILEWRFPKPHQHLVLTGRSRAAWHTSFIVPALNLLLDAGLCVNRLRPKHVFLTHGHSDHTLLVPAFVAHEDPPDVFCPEEMQRELDDFVRASRMLNRGGGLTGAEEEEEKKEEAPEITHVSHGLRPGHVVSLRRVKGMPVTATAFRCDHTVPCLGYVFSVTTQRLRPEFASLAGPELQARRRAGAELTAPHRSPVFAFLGDTTAGTLAAAPAWLREGIPVVITECSFLYDEHRAQADKTKHTAWGELEEVVRAWPRTVFVLTHFSMRYSDAEVVAFFREMRQPLANIVVWADPDS